VTRVETLLDLSLHEEGFMTRSRIWIVPVMMVAAALVMAPAMAADDGKALFGSKCAMCHGANGVAGKMAAGSKNFTDPEFKKTTTADGIVKIVHDGKGKMKGLGDKLTAEQAKAVAEYVLSLK
jgi:mono/diheme cytochrome c family protein